MIVEMIAKFSLILRLKGEICNIVINCIIKVSLLTLTILITKASRITQQGMMKSNHVQIQIIMTVNALSQLWQRMILMLFRMKHKMKSLQALNS